MAFLREKIMHFIPQIEVFKRKKYAVFRSKQPVFDLNRIINVPITSVNEVIGSEGPRKLLVRRQNPSFHMTIKPKILKSYNYSNRDGLVLLLELEPAHQDSVFYSIVKCLSCFYYYRRRSGVCPLQTDQCGCQRYYTLPEL